LVDRLHLEEIIVRIRAGIVLHKFTKHGCLVPSEYVHTRWQGH